MTPLWVTARQWSLEGQTFLPEAYWPILRRANNVDISLRVSDSTRSATLILTTSHRDSLLALLPLLEDAGSVVSVERAMSADKFDAMVTLDDRRFHLQAQHSGFLRDGHSLGCDFRLYSVWTGQAPEDDIDYQICLRSNPVTSDLERRVRKYLAWLELEEPFTDAVRNLQSLLARRLLEPSWIADEYLLFDSDETRTEWIKRMPGRWASRSGEPALAHLFRRQGARSGQAHRPDRR